MSGKTIGLLAVVGILGYIAYNFFIKNKGDKKDLPGGSFVSNISTSATRSGIPIKEIITKPAIKVEGPSKFEDGPVYGNISPNVMYRYFQKVENR